ncbi:MAG: 2-amino-4-hydroxy-6-hydroxymethyldihydropteridine diphosphokinase [Gammaproteobacteria bacterium]|nr:MAG: 2-amino-4-hydroxy-6-hydroxymethyldihydropteridine diphosphokinase [Gammaproteobacteria bacterium]
MATIWISLGSNIEPERHLRNALGCMQHHFYDLALSPVYETEAVGFEGDPFLNLVARCRTTLDPVAVAEELKAIEDRNERLRTGPKFSARTLDLDLLLYDDQVLDSPQIPRDEILRYAFVLRPLADLDPELHHPLTGRSMAEHWAEFDASDQPMRPVDLDLLQD